VNKKHLFIMAFLITIGVISWGEIKECHELPWPPKFVGAAITFGMLDLFSILSEDLAAVIAIGIVLASLVNKGFTTNCQHAQGTAQPADYASFDTGSSSPVIAT
jgi:hypothetical protein